jgi:hypothetical protein
MAENKQQVCSRLFTFCFITWFRSSAPSWKLDNWEGIYVQCVVLQQAKVRRRFQSSKHLVNAIFSLLLQGNCNTIYWRPSFCFQTYIFIWTTFILWKDSFLPYSSNYYADILQLKRLRILFINLSIARIIRGLTRHNASSATVAKFALKLIILLWVLETFCTYRLSSLGYVK